MRVNTKTKRIILIVVVAVVSALLIFLSVMGIIMAVTKNPNMDWTQHEKVRFIAHRGLSSQYYQNTQLAFEKAAESDFFYAIETDIWRTADGVWVCAHDNNPFNDSSVLINSRRYDDIKNMPLKFDEKFSEEQLICTFEKYLEICFLSNKVPIIEIKNTYSQEMLKEVYEIAKHKAGGKQFQIISFKKENVDRLYQIDGKLKLQLLVGSRNIRLVYSRNMGYNMAVYYKLASKRFVDRCHANNASVNVWTVNDAALAKKLMDMGVDYITTDYILFS